ncbi:AraC family transcriptional regulator [Nocardioides gilvus]|uniref:AraC family transcriptional regulator n=1 Tax=Nocardioides gilvus TaxID=1735589 RepID=UPI000D74552D|nr:AraC family transcriptional regulator [Nocardioides gilvus]
MHPVPKPQVFDVSSHPLDQSVEVWEEHNAAALVGLTCRVPDSASFRAKEVNLQLHRLHLARVQGTPHTVVRDASMVSQRPSDSIVVYASLRGEALWEHAGARRIVRPGQLLVCDVDRPFLRGFGHGLEELAIKVPRDAFTELTGLHTVDVPLFLDTTGAEADPYARALVRQVGRAVGRSAVPPDERTILELVSVIATGGRIGLPVAHRAAARAFIDDHLTDTSLSAADVAAGAGISERHLSRLFAETGASVPQHILARRLDLAHSLLGRPETREHRIVDIAASCGFTSTAYFSDAFKRRFDATAGAVRRSAAV